MRAGTGSEPDAKYSAVRHLGFVFHVSGSPTKHIAGLYWCAKFAWNTCNSFYDMNVWMFCNLAWKCLFTPQSNGGTKYPKLPLPLGYLDPHLIHECLSHPRRHIHRFTLLRATTQQIPLWLQWEAPNSPLPKLLPFNDNHPHLIHTSLDRTQTASGSNQRFCHSTPTGLTNRQTDRHTHRPTDGLSKKLVTRVLRPMLFDRERRINKFCCL